MMRRLKDNIGGRDYFEIHACEWELLLMFLSNPNFTVRSKAQRVLEHMESLSFCLRFRSPILTLCSDFHYLAFVCIR